MKHFILTTVFFIISCNLFCNPNNINSLSHYDKKILELDSSYQTLEKKHLQMMDSLNNQIDKFVAREDYLSVALEDQASRFTLIVSGLLAIAALIGYVSYKIELLRLKRFVNRKMTEHQKEFNRQKEKIQKLEGNLRISMANTFASVAYSFRKENEHGLAFDFYLRASRDHGLAYITHRERIKHNPENKEKAEKKLVEDLGVVNSCLEFALNDLQKLSEGGNNSKSHTNLESVVSDITELYKINDKDIDLKIAQIRVKFDEYISNIESQEEE